MGTTGPGWSNFAGWGQGDSTLWHGSQGHGCKKMSRRCHCLSSSQKTTRCVSTGLGICPSNTAESSPQLFDSTVAKLWQTTVLPASPGWFHVNRGEYPIVNSHTICEKKPKKSTGENFHPFCTCLMLSEWLMEKPLGVVSSSILCPTWLKFAVAVSTKKKPIWETFRTW